MVEAATQALSLDQFTKLKNEGCLIVDTRPPPEIRNGYITGSICIPIGSFYTRWADGILPKEAKILIVATPGQENQSITDLVNLGFADVQGYLEGGYDTWVKAGNPVQEYKSITAKDLVGKLSDTPHILDVRNKDEWDQGTLEDAQLISMFNLLSRTSEVPKDKPVYVHCKLGGRSLVASTILTSQGFNNVIDILGGIDNIVAAGAQLKHSAPTSVL